MPIFIKLKNVQRELLFKSVKKNINCSWEELYPKLNIGRAMFFNYLSGEYDIPKNTFLKLQKIAEIRIKNIQQTKKERHLEKEIIKPKMNSCLAEIFGILNGDGHISSLNHEICVVGSILEKDYFNYLKKLFQDNLNLKFTILVQNTGIKLRTYSKRLAILLNNKYGLPRGNKLGKLKIPKQVFKTKKWLKSYIRGMFDTDGSIFIRRKKDMVVEFISADPRFLMEIKNALNSLGFSAGISGCHAYLYKREEIKRFFKEIKPSNSKHLKKFKMYSNL